MDNQKRQQINLPGILELRSLKNLKQQPCVQDIQSSVTLEQGNFKKLKQPCSVQSEATTVSTCTENHVNQGKTNHTSHRNVSTDNLDDASNQGEPIPSAELLTTIETQDKGDKKRLEIPNTEHINVYCHTCNSEVYGKDIFSHLFFGRLGCTRCTSKIVSCKTLLSMYHSKTGCNSGPHNYSKWDEKDFPSYLDYHIRKDLVIKRFCHNLGKKPELSEVKQAIADYVKKLHVIRSYHPWKLAFSSNQYFFNEQEGSTQRLAKKREFDSNHTASHNKSREQVNKTAISLKKSYMIQGDGHGSKSNGNASTHERENVLVNSVDKYSPPESNDPKDLNKSNKYLKVSQSNEFDHNEIKEQGNDGGLSSVNLNTVQHDHQYSSSVDNSLTRASEIVGKNTIDESPSAGTNDLKMLNQYDKHVKGSEYNESDFAPHALLAGDKCLIVHHPREKCPSKCPECHCTLCSSRLTFDCSTCVMKIVCPDCTFPVYIVPDLKTKSTYRKHFHHGP